MFIEWPDDERCPYCSRKGKVVEKKVDTTYELVAAANERAVLNHRIRKHEERIAELEARLAKVRVALVEHSPSKALLYLDGDVCE